MHVYIVLVLSLIAGALNAQAGDLATLKTERARALERASIYTPILQSLLRAQENHEHYFTSAVVVDPAPILKAANPDALSKIDSALTKQASRKVQREGMTVYEIDRGILGRHSRTLAAFRDILTLMAPQVETFMIADGQYRNMLLYSENGATRTEILAELQALYEENQLAFTALDAVAQNVKGRPGKLRTALYVLGAVLGMLAAIVGLLILLTGAVFEGGALLILAGLTMISGGAAGGISVGVAHEKAIGTFDSVTASLRQGLSMQQDSIFRRIEELKIRGPH